MKNLSKILKWKMLKKYTWMKYTPKNKLQCKMILKINFMKFPPHKIDFWQKCSPKIYFSEKRPPKYPSMKYVFKIYFCKICPQNRDFIKKIYHKNILQWKIPSKIIMKNAKKLLEQKIPKNTYWLETTEHSPDCTSRIKNQSRVTLCNKVHSFIWKFYSEELYSLWQWKTDSSQTKKHQSSFC